MIGFILKGIERAMAVPAVRPIIMGFILKGIESLLTPSALLIVSNYVSSSKELKGQFRNTTSPSVILNKSFILKGIESVFWCLPTGYHVCFILKGIESLFRPLFFHITYRMFHPQRN